MKTIIFTFTLYFFTTYVFSQNTISGQVLDNKGKPVVGANIYIDGTYDGTSSSDIGEFSFTTTSTGNQTLVVSFLIYETFTVVIDVANYKNQTIKIIINNFLTLIVIIFF